VIVEVDHILIAVPDPDATAARLAAALGLPLAGGGVHPAIGTRNALLSLGGPYLELIGPLDGPTGDHGRPASHPIGDAVRAALEGRATGGYVTVALRSDDIATDAARLRAAGSSLASDVVRRARPDGTAIAWSVAFPPRLGPDAAPFLIEHEPAEPERAARLRDTGLRLARLEVRVSDPAAVAAAWASTLGIRFVPEASEAAGPPTAAGRPDAGSSAAVGGSPLGAPASRLIATIGSHRVVLVAAAPVEVAQARIDLIGRLAARSLPAPSMVAGRVRVTVGRAPTSASAVPDDGPAGS
jgi:catechol 2,3-dioxygenase-like lactoylglutathione lyase family enzyme